MLKPIGFIAACAFLAPSVTLASDSGQIITGGRLYDVWWVDTNLKKPDKEHPAYPKEGKKKRSTTWRCKECHGWDYQGKDGAYHNGGHFTGIKGIRKKAGSDIADIIAILKNDRHQFSGKLPEKELAAIALFVSKGQINMDDYIDKTSRKAKGDPTKGKSVYEDNCQRCHGNKGTDLGLAHKSGIKSYMGDVSNENPWETLHKIRFGHPDSKMGTSQMQGGGHTMHEHHHEKFTMGETMPPMFGKLTEEQEKDLLTYIQTLPKAASISIF